MKIQDEANKYHTTRAINNSMLKAYIDNPFMAGLRYWSDVKLPEVSKEAYKQGDALHARYWSLRGLRMSIQSSRKA